MKKLTISLVTYNSARYIPYLAASFNHQTFTDWDLIIIDNNSYDDTVAVVSEHLPNAKLIKQKTNLGFAKAHNLIITWSKTPYILVINPDIILEPTCIEKLVNALDSMPEVASVGGKLLHWNFETQEKTNSIDSFGLNLSRNYKTVDAYQGREDFALRGGFVFGISGALCMMRRDALDTVKIARPLHGQTSDAFEYYDEDFFAYKEDADIAWRLILAGWRNYFVPSAVAYHARQISNTAQTRHDRKKRGAINRYSYRNHLLMVYKNHFWSLTLRSIISISTFEIAKFFYLALLDGSSIRGLREFLGLVPRFRSKRSVVVQDRKISALEFKRWYL